MKKIYLFLAMLLGMFSSTATFAQPTIKIGDKWYMADLEAELVTPDMVSSPYTETAEGSIENMFDGQAGTFWHSVWTGGSVTPGLHYFQVELPIDMPELVMFKYVRRSSADNDHTTLWSVRGTDDFEAEKDDCPIVVEVDTPFTSKEETCWSQPFAPGSYTYLRFYSERQAGASYQDRGYFHVGEFQIYPVVEATEDKVAGELLYEAFLKYEPQLYEYEYGDEPGFYDEDAYWAFDAAVTELETKGENPPADLTVAQAEQIIADCESALQALKASKKQLVLASGYYRIKAGMGYTNDVPTGEKDEEGNDITESMDVDKYMCGYRSNGKLWAIWATPDFTDLVDNAQALWKIDAKGDGTYDIVSIYHDGRFTQVERSTNAEMDPESTSLMAIDVVTTEDGISYANLRVSTQDADNYYYLHQGGHNNGEGVSGYILGWCTTWSGACGASEWCFEKVEDDEAAKIISDFAVTKDKDKWVADLKFILDDVPAKITIAKDIQTIVEEDTPVISDENWITSPCSDSSEGQHIEYLWDGDGSTFWHSSWHGEYEIEPHHFIQVEIPEDMGTAVFRMTRRNTTSGNQINKWTVWGTNSDFEETLYDDEPMIQGSEGLEKLADLTTPYHAGKNTEVCTSEVFDTKGYKYLRFYVAGTCNNDGTQGGNEKFFHLAEFQLYKGHTYQSPTNQYAVMGSVATNLEAQIANVTGVADEDLDYSTHYAPLKAAYDAFIAIYVDPTALRDAILAASDKLESVVVGTNPGFWSSNAAAPLTNVVNEATAYNEAGAYTPSGAEDLIARLESETADVDSKIIPVQEGKWYRIRYGTEDEYAQYGWPTDGNTTDYWNTDDHTNDDEYVYNEAIFGKFLIPATWEDVTLGQNDNGDDVKGHRVIALTTEEIVADTYVFADADEDIEEKDLSMWRFIKVGDGYAIQNKATGLFMQKNGDMRVSPSPSLFSQLAAGYGQNTFIESSLENGTQGSPMHLARNYNILTTWGSKQSDGLWSGMGGYDGRRACFFVEEVGDVASDFTSADFKINFVPGDIYGRCFPVTITVKDPEQGELWTVNSLESTDETVKVTLAKITETTIPAGRPFFYVAAGDFDPDADVDAVPSDFSLAFDIINTPQTSGYLKGTFDSKKMEERFLTAGSGHEDGALKFYNAGTTLGNNRVYITPNGESFPSSAALEIVFDANAGDGIQSALQNIARTGDIYTIDGRLVGKGNLNSLNQKGIYILNGTKVIVK